MWVLAIFKFDVALFLTNEINIYLQHFRLK